MRDRAVTPFDEAVVERLERMTTKAPEVFDRGDLEADDGKTDDAPGETARLVLRMPFPSATALVTVEREGIMHAFVTRLAGDRPTLSIPIEARYAPYVLAIADEAGWPLSADTRDTLIAGLEAFLKGCDDGPRRQAFADRTLRRLLVIEALSRYGAATPDLMADLDVQPQHWPTSALLDWIAILRRVDGIPERAARRAQAARLLRARRVVQGTGLVFTTPQAGPLWWLMGSQDVDAVRAVLTLLPEADWQGDLPRLLRGALARQRQGHWDLTTANAWGRLALERFSATFERQPVTGRTQGALGGETRGHTWTERGSGSAADWLFPWPDGPARPTLALTHEGQGQPWALIQSRAAVPLKAPLFAGYTIARTLTPVAQRRPGQWSRGDLAQVRLDLTAAAAMGGRGRG